MPEIKNLAQTFIDRKKADSPFVQLKNDKDFVKIKVSEITSGTNNFGQEVMIVKGEVETEFGKKNKQYSNGSISFAEGLLGMATCLYGQWSLVR